MARVLSVGGHPRRWVVDRDRTPARVADGFLRDPVLTALAAAMGADSTDPAGLSRWSSERLDTRRGHERQVARPATLTPAEVDSVLRAAETFGMLASPPPSRPAYDVTVVLGGTATGNRLRLRYLAGIEDAGTSTGLVVGLAADRPFDDAELAAAGVPTATTEARDLALLLADTCAQEDFADLSAPADLPLDGNGGRRVRMMSAPPTRPGRRADTADAVAFLVTRLGPSQRGSVLLVTSSVYVPYQLLTAGPRLLEAGTATVEAVGTPATNPDRAFRAQAAAQELHASIQAAVRSL